MSVRQLACTGGPRPPGTHLPSAGAGMGVEEKHLVAAAPTLESQDSKRSWDAVRHPPGICCLLPREGEEAVHPGREASFASENKNLYFKNSFNLQIDTSEGKLAQKGLGRGTE